LNLPRAARFRLQILHAFAALAIRDRPKGLTRNGFLVWLPTCNMAGVVMTRETYGQIYQEGRDRTIRFLLSRGVTRELAADLAQSAWLRGWERISQLRDERMLVTWVNTIALNLFRRAIRNERFHGEIHEAIHGTVTLNLAAIDVARLFEVCRQSDRALLEAQMAGITAKEMAEEEGVTETAIRIRFHRARRSARTVLERRKKLVLEDPAASIAA